MRAHPQRRACLKRCRHCRIFFLSHPCNAQRQDLRCPFGCSQAHRKRESTRRSVAYYQDQDCKKYRRRQNAKRCRRGPRLVLEPPPKPNRAIREANSSPWPTSLLGHVQMVVSLIEGRPVSRQELLSLLEKIVRQHSLGQRRKIDQTLAWLKEQPP